MNLDKYSQQLRQAFTALDDAKIELVKAISFVKQHPELNVVHTDVNTLLDQLLVLLNKVHAVVSEQEELENNV